MSAFGTRLKSLRQAKQMTQSQLAQAAGLHLNQIVRYELRNAEPKANAVCRLATALQCSTDTLLIGKTPADSLSDRLSRQLLAIQSLPKDTQKIINKTLEALIGWNSRQ